MKKILKAAIMLLVALFFLSACSQDVNEIINSVNSSPNILLIIADDMGLDATPGYNIGSIKPVMPNIQILSDNGIRFNNFWSNPTCTPTRSTIITGKYGFRVGVTKVDDELSTSETSLQKYLSENTSYSNAVIGKWHLSKDANHPNSIGVDYYAGLLTGAVPSYSNWSFTENGQTENSTEYITSKFSDIAIDWLESQSDPWFLWLAYTAPHTPFHLPPDSLHTQDGLSSDQASIDANPLHYYMAMLESMDTEIGRVLSSLSTSELENTLIIFIGDNGTPNEAAQDYNSHRVKGTVYKGGINVPMIISGEGVSRVNEVENALINSTDLFATIANIAGISIDNINDSKNFKSLLSGDNNNSRDYLYSEAGKSSGESDYTIRTQTHKYIKFDDGSEALYNLNENLMENPNLMHPNQLPLSSEDEAIKNELLLKLAEIRD
ncbi:MAG: sulfatase-like hydrolase/transferase [Ignavibacteriae bacterium]|nr:sulfatase-like hydrolase/transferase [Ignavibacteriota bacterium]